MSTQEYRHIVRVAGKDIDGQENLLQGLTRIKGVGLRMSKTLIQHLGLDPMARIGYLDEETIEKIEKVLSDPVAAGFPDWYVNCLLYTSPSPRD